MGRCQSTPGANGNCKSAKLRRQPGWMPQAGRICPSGFWHLPGCTARTINCIQVIRINYGLHSMLKDQDCNYLSTPTVLEVLAVVKLCRLYLGAGVCFRRRAPWFATSAICGFKLL